MLISANFIWWIQPVMLLDVDDFSVLGFRFAETTSIDAEKYSFFLLPRFQPARTSDQSSMIMSVCTIPFSSAQCGGSVSRRPHRSEEKPTVEGGAGKEQPPTDGPLCCLCRHCQQDQPVKWQGKRLLCEENVCATNNKSNH